MSRSWIASLYNFQRLVSGKKRQPITKNRRRPQLEYLEDRVVPAAFTWDADAAGNWSDAANWSIVSGADGDGIPDADDDVTFDATSVEASTVDTAFTIKSLTIAGGYTGNIDLQADLSVKGGFDQDGGAVDINSNRLTAGMDFDIDAGTFDADTGTVEFTTFINFGPGTVDADGIVFNDVEINYGSHHFSIDGELDVNGELSIGGLNTLSGDIRAAGDVHTSDSNNSNSSSGTIIFDGTSTQNLTGSGDGALPNIEINKSGKLNIDGDFIVNGDWTYVKGNVDANVSTVEFRGGTHTIDTDSVNGSMAFDNVVIQAGSHHFNVHRLDVNGDLTIESAQTINALGASEGAITVGGDLTSNDTAVGGDAGITLDGGTKSITGGDFSNGGIVIDMNSGATLHANVTTPLDSALTIRKVGAISGIFEVGKNVTTEDTSVGGSGVIAFRGSSAQTLTAFNDLADVPSVNINKTGGSLTLANNGNTLAVTGDWIYDDANAAAVITTGTTVQFQSGTKTVSTGSASMVFNDVEINMNSGATFKADPMVDIDGNLTIIKVGAISGLIKASGDVTTEDTSVGGSGVIRFDGAGDQRLVASVDYADVPSVEIKKTGGTLTIDDDHPIAVTGDWVYVTGTVDAIDEFGSTVQFQGGTKTVNTGSPLAFDFSQPVTTGPTQAPGVWYTDRYDPAAFTTDVFSGESVLKHSIDASDGATSRPGSFSSAFYNTQGRKYDIFSPAVTTMAIDLFVPSDWETSGRRMAGMWGVATDALGDISGYPIIEFASDGVSGWFQIYTQDTDQDTGNGLTPGFIELGLPSDFVYDEWYRLETELTPTSYNFKIVGATGSSVDALTFSDTVTLGSVQFDNVILQGHNTTDGVTYDIYWDNFTVVPPSMSFNNVEINMNSGATFKADPEVDVDGDLTIIKVGAISGLIKASGDVTTDDTSVGGAGVIRFDGSGSQTLAASTPYADVPSVSIMNTGGTLTVDPTNPLAVTGNWIYDDATGGTVITTGSTIQFQSGTKTVSTGSASMAFNDVEINMNSGATLKADPMVDVNGDLTIIKVGAISGLIKASGDVTTKDTSVGGSGVICFDGNGNQTLKSTVERGDVPSVEITKTGGKLFLDDNEVIAVTGNWIYISGNVDEQNSVIEFQSGSKTVDTGSASMNFHDVIVEMNSGATLFAENMRVGGDLTINKVGAISSPASGRIRVAGNLTSNDTGVGGNADITLVGGSKTITGGDFSNGGIIVNMNSGATLTANVLQALDGNLLITKVANINGILPVAKNVTTSDTGVGGNGVIKFTGNSNQLLSAAVSMADVPSVEIDKSGGTLSIDAGNTISVTGNWTYVAGNVNAAGSTVKFQSGSKTVDTGVASMNFNNVVIDMSSGATLTAVNMDVEGDLTIEQVANINGTVEVAGNVTTGDTGVGGSGTILFDGSGDQILSASVEYGDLPSVEIDKSGGTLTVDASAGFDEISVTGNWTYVAGTVDMADSTIKFQSGSKTVDTGVASMDFNNVVIDMSSGATLSAVNMDVEGNLTIAGIANINGIVEVAGNVTTGDTGVGGSGTILFDGTGDQILSASVAYGDLPSIEIDKSGGTLSVDDSAGFDEISVTGNWIYVAGTVDMADSTIKFQSGSKTVDTGIASMDFNNVVIDMSSGATLSAVNIDVEGNLTIENVANINGTIEVAGNVESFDGGVGGSGTIVMNGSDAATISGGDFPNGGIEITKTGGATVTLASDLSGVSSLLITSGILDLSTYTLGVSGSVTVSSSGELSFTVDDTTKTSSQMSVGGNMTFASSSKLTVVDSGLLSGSSFTLIDVAGDLTDNGVVITAPLGFTVTVDTLADEVTVSKA